MVAAKMLAPTMNPVIAAPYRMQDQKRGCHECRDQALIRD